MPAQEIEDVVATAIRERLDGSAEDQTALLIDRDLIDHYAERVTVRTDGIEIRFNAGPESASSGGASVIHVPWTKSGTRAVKGILHTPPTSVGMTGHDKEHLLRAIAKARAWVEDLAAGRVSSFADIATQEGKVERHIRLLAPLAFVSPQMISEIADGSFPSIGVTDLAKAVTGLWAEQARTIHAGIIKRQR